MMNPKENFLRAIRFEKPEYVPMKNEPIWKKIELEGIFKMESWTDIWGIGWESSLEGAVPFPIKTPLPDIRKLVEYKFPNPDSLVFTDEMVKTVQSVDPDKELLMGHMTCLLFERAWALMGMENFFTALCEYPDECHELLHNIAAYGRKVFDRYIEIGVDVIASSEDLGSQRSLMISPAMFREFFLPEYKYMFENVLKENKIIRFHSCGCVEDIVADLASINMTILNPVQKMANDLSKIKKSTYGKMALDGGIPTHVLLTGTPEDVRKEVIDTLEILMPGGGYICGPDQSIPGIPKENMDALWDTVKQYGKYSY